MDSLTRTAEILGATHLTQQEISAIRDHIQLMAELTFKAWLNHLLNTNEKSNEVHREKIQTLRQ